ncbi:ABC transporter ATP-binding protein [Fulvivirga sedimenti]|jgi:putative ABC transport system ATP-binding protein|uniref:ABC transporter ATP-binding protein n=1 Tax=Fulvivirga sedimenti TaxID=2879465 RepID=A0A9X1HJY7_9BACT|nr:ABC transporter ATP-binding protein [Fulvivirga sedimenti]MCA6073554.1 ABC transporter ATP-binding protein [Fulvivirga sedimenti]
MAEILSLENVSKKFKSGIRELTVLDNISFTVNEGDSMSIVGPSGSGKTTLLGLCAGLDVPSSGHVVLAGIRLDALNEDDRAYMRNQHVGFIFQNFQLLPTLTALENVRIPLELRGERGGKQLALDLLAKVGLGDRSDHYPSQLSGGEQQRVAIARAFITKPKILFADEPTGNLDEETAQTVTDLLFQLNRESGTTLVLVTHNMELAHFTDRILELRGGKLHADRLTVS